MLLNGNALEFTSAGDTPTLSPLQADSFTPTSVAPYSIAFVTIPDAGIGFCNSWCRNFSHDIL